MKVVFYPDTDSIAAILATFPKFNDAKFVAYGIAGVLQEPISIEAGTQCWFIPPHKGQEYEAGSFSQLKSLYRTRERGNEDDQQNT